MTCKKAFGASGTHADQIGSCSSARGKNSQLSSSYPTHLEKTSTTFSEFLIFGIRGAVNLRSIHPVGDLVHLKIRKSDCWVTSGFKFWRPSCKHKHYFLNEIFNLLWLYYLELTCCWNSRLHLRVGDASDLVNDMQVFLPFQNGSSVGISIGKHFLVSNDSRKFKQFET